jgi:hypothetical protein
MPTCQSTNINCLIEKKAGVGRRWFESVYSLPLQLSLRIQLVGFDKQLIVCEKCFSCQNELYTANGLASFHWWAGWNCVSSKGVNEAERKITPDGEQDATCLALRDK